MAVAAPARRSSAPATAPPPSRTAPPRRKKASPRGAAAAPAPSRAPARRKPARKAPSRRIKPGSRVAAGGQLIPIAVGRSAAAVRHLPDSGLVVRMTRGRAWIAVLGILLVGIVGLNVVTLSFAASSGKVDENNTALEQENTMLTGRAATAGGPKIVRHEAAAMGLAMPTTSEPTVIHYGPNVVARAAARLAAAG